MNNERLKELAGIVTESSDLVQVPNVGKIDPEQLKKKIGELAATIAKMVSGQSEDFKYLTSKTEAFNSHVEALVKHYKSLH